MEPHGRLGELAASVTGGLGYELVGIEFRPGRTRSLLRLYIDAADGVGLEDCARVSRQLGAALDVEDVLPGAYTLEVSSPGLDRPLFTPAHYRRFVGAEVRVHLRAMDAAGRRRLLGRLLAADERGIRLAVEGSEIDLPFERIDRARLVPEL